LNEAGVIHLQGSGKIFFGADEEQGSSAVSARSPSPSYLTSSKGIDTHGLTGVGVHR